jgi:defect-in-organelle-trafficking protein DotB
VRTLDFGVEAVREWIALDRPLRQRLGAEPPERWSTLLRAEVEARGTSMESAARALLQAGRIDRSTYLEAAGIVGCEA